MRYLAGLLFIAIGIYQAVEKQDIPETLLYGFLGLAFIVMGFINQHPEHPHKKLLGTISWVFTIAAALSFLYVLTIPY